MAVVRVEVVYALASAQDVAVVELAEGTRALGAIEASGVLTRHPEIDPHRVSLGRFGREIRMDEPLRDGDRIEILRALVVRPMEARRLRARKGARNPR